MTRPRWSLVGGSLVIASAFTALASAQAQGRFEGTVRTATGKRPVLAQVQLSDGQHTWADSLGRFTFDSVPVGEVVATARAALFLADSVRVTIQPRHTRRHDFVLPVDSLWVVKREARWLGCRAVSAGATCVPVRRITYRLTGFRRGAWLFTDSTSLARVWFAHTQYHASEGALPQPRLDWTRESVVAVSYGSYSACGPRFYVNRAERRADTTAILVGPDSLYDGPPQITCTAVVSSADFVVVPLPPGPVVVRPANPNSQLPPLGVEVVPRALPTSH